jgi:hypothetical protein
MFCICNDYFKVFNIHLSFDLIHILILQIKEKKRLLYAGRQVLVNISGYNCEPEQKPNMEILYTLLKIKKPEMNRAFNLVSNILYLTSNSLYIYLSILCMCFYKLPTWWYFISHKHRKDTVCICKAIYCYLF